MSAASCLNDPDPVRRFLSFVATALPDERNADPNYAQLLMLVMGAQDLLTFHFKDTRWMQERERIQAELEHLQ